MGICRICPALGGAGEGRVGIFHANVHMAADKAQAGVAHHRAGEQAGFEQNLKAVADAEDQSAAFGEFFHGLHHRREAGDRAGAQIVAVGKAAGQDDGVAVRQIFGLVPDEFNWLVKDLPMA